MSSFLITIISWIAKFTLKLILLRKFCEMSSYDWKSRVSKIFVTFNFLVKFKLNKQRGCTLYNVHKRKNVVCIYRVYVQFEYSDLTPIKM